MAELIAALGEEPPRQGELGFAGLGRAIVYQQISGAAGNAIVQRLRRAAGAPRFPSSSWFVRTGAAELRRCGLSPQKLSYLQDLAGHVESGRLELGRLGALSDEQVIEELTDVKGIGRWTAEMYLMFALQRPDILPVGDLGLQKGVQHAYGFRALPSKRTISRLGERWRPYRSYATHYLWRSLERPPWEGLREASTSVRGAPRRAQSRALK